LYFRHTVGITVYRVRDGVVDDGTFVPEFDGVTERD
jgi:hypothetical protein